MSKETSKTIAYIRTILEKLSCPYLEDGSDQWLAELLLHASETRLQLLHWLIVTYDDSFKDFLNNALPVISSRLDSRHQKLLHTLNMMCVCSIDEMEFIRATASQKKQLNYWKTLSEMCYISQFGAPYNETCHETDNNVSYFLKPAVPPTLNESFTKSCKFIDTFACTFKPNEVFADPKLLSKENENSINVPPIEELIETGGNIRTMLQTTIESLEKMKTSDINIERLEQSIIENYCRKIDLSFNMFSQMIDNFTHCYDNEISAWCNKSKPVLSDIGEAIVYVDSLYSPEIDLFESIRQLKVTIETLNDSIDNDVQRIKENINSDMVSLNDYRNEKAIIEESLRRMKISITEES